MSIIESKNMLINGKYHRDPKNVGLFIKFQTWEQGLISAWGAKNAAEIKFIRPLQKAAQQEGPLLFQHIIIIMELMPDEVLASIFKYFEVSDLGRIAVASKSWKSLTENPVLRFDIKTIAVQNVTIENVSKITRGIKKCEKLHLTNCSIGSNKLANVIQDIKSDLRSIKLVNCHLSDTHTNKIFQAAGSCPHLEKLVISTEDPKLNLFNELGLEPLLQCEKLHTVTIDGLECSKFEIISPLMDKLWRYSFTNIYSELDRKVVYVHDDHVRGFCSNREGFVKFFPHPGPHNEKHPFGVVANQVVYYPVKWTFKAETYQVIKREKMYLADRDETIHDELEDLSNDMQNRAKELFKTNDTVYVMLILFKEDRISTGETAHDVQLEYDFKTRPPFWED